MPLEDINTAADWTITQSALGSQLENIVSSTTRRVDVGDEERCQLPTLADSGYTLEMSKLVYILSLREILIKMYVP